MEHNYRIGSCQAKTEPGCVGIARFTCHEWNGKDGLKLEASHSVELKIRFNHETKKWDIVDQREWNGAF